ncbi:hypothetical protein GDO86_016790 [Hymenochirus boettgeri]|uniref:Uncharacterized protein n=1 Tax=Hymenochirus boettgeri TaxID=247094 RepID=A0A8T2IKW6_9PIPI|nr:hypothetical protein GDO86_016790 [Hymenochirus boettgeri]
MLETVLRQEGKYPMRTDMEFWKEHRRQRGFGFGPLTEEGQKWYTLRSVLNQKMLRPVEVKMYMGSVNEVVTDFLVTLDEMRTQTPSGNMVNEIQNALYRFAFEGISYILFETRIGCLDKKIPEATREFIDSIGVMFKNTVITGVLPSWTKNVLPYYKRYMESWDNIFAFGNKLIDQKMLKIKCRIEKGEEVRGEYLTYLISSGKLTKNEIYGSVAELLLAGVDTTSNTLSWALYHLAREPEIQKELYQEVIGVIPGQSLPSAEDISRMPLLRAVIKEILRLYPVIPTNSRFLVEKEITAGGYYLPKNTLVVLAHYAISRDETNFPEPNKFIPQRWIRENRTQNNPFSSIPFGYGVRACVGRRIAELEMYTCLSRDTMNTEMLPLYKLR